jgi:hypothetical protein
VASRLRALVAGSLLLCLWAPPCAAANTVEAQDVVLRDGAGNLSVAVTPDNAGARSLVVFDREGTVRAIVDIGPDGLPALSLIGSDGRTRTRVALLAEDSIRLVVGEGPTGGTESVRPVGQGPGPGMSAPAPIMLTLGLALLVLALTVVLLGICSARWTRALQELSRAFAEDRQRERDGYLHFVSTRAKDAGDERALQLAEAAGAELVKNLEQARAEIGTLAERLQAR